MSNSQRNFSSMRWTIKCGQTTPSAAPRLLSGLRHPTNVISRTSVACWATWAHCAMMKRVLSTLGLVGLPTLIIRSTVEQCSLWRALTRLSCHLPQVILDHGWVRAWVILQIVTSVRSVSQAPITRAYRAWLTRPPSSPLQVEWSISTSL